MLMVRRSLELERQRAIRDYEASLHQWEAETAATNERAKIAHSRKGLQARVKCTKAVMRAKYDYRVAVQEARATWCNELEEAETAYSEALHENAATQSLHCTTLRGEHVKYMSELEERALEVEIKSWQDFLSTHSAVLCHASPSLKADLHSSYNILLGNSSSLLQSFPSVRVSQVQGQPPATTSLKSEPTQSQWPKRQNPLPDLQGDMFIDEDSPKGLQEDLLCSKREKASDWFSSLKPSRADAFCWDSSSVREARECYFATHPWDWVQNNTDDLSDIFRKLAQSTGLLGKSIFEIQWSWDGPVHLKHSNYVLRSLPKGLKFLRAVSAKECPKIMGLKGIHDPNALWHFASYTYCPWCGKDGQNERTIINHLRTVHYKLGLLCDQCFRCPAVMSDALHCHGCNSCTN